MKKTLLALALIGASTSSFADALLYGGASVGQSTYKGHNATSYTVHVGSGILPFIGVEAGLTKFGDFDIAPGQTMKADTAYVALKPSIDVGPVHLYAKGGLHSWNEEVNGTKADDGYDLMYGVGAEYFIMGPFSVGANYQTYKMDDENVSDFSLNATFHFL
jgi:hypothetical protein